MRLDELQFSVSPQMQFPSDLCAPIPLKVATFPPIWTDCPVSRLWLTCFNFYTSGSLTHIFVLPHMLNCSKWSIFLSKCMIYSRSSLSHFRGKLTRREWDNIFKVLKEKILPNKSTYPAKLSLRNGRDRKTFQDKKAEGFLDLPYTKSLVGVLTVEM